MPPDPLSLVRVDDDESHLGRSRPQDHVAPATDDHGPPASSATATNATWLTKSTLRKNAISCSEAASHSEEAAVEGLGAGASNGREEVRPVVRCEGADFDAASIAQQLTAEYSAASAMANNPRDAQRPIPKFVRSRGTL